MKNGGGSVGAVTSIFDDCYSFACHFSLTSFEPYNREEANKVAHDLAR